MAGKGDGEGEGNIIKLENQIAVIKYVLLFTNCLEWIPKKRYLLIRHVLCWRWQRQKTFTQRQRCGASASSYSLAESYKKCTIRKLALQKNVICDKCEGRGNKKGAVELFLTSRDLGMQVQVQQLAPGMLKQIQTVFVECRRQGENINPRDRCKQ
ncbi:unnamed protein product [Ceutorhynchus assimilis]|uniref:Uncharacterized protein n=1 Tax=Ceutorhynchus assimilis TaxID=467358 RepID=A0A9N9ME90_9CUCU|nr:unnamed protein product [Ceutorhynchus assimilis]